MKPFRFFGSIMAIVVWALVVSVAAICTILYFSDPNQLKPIIIDEVKKRTPYELKIEGPFTLSFYPRLAIKIDYMAISNQGELLPFVDLRDIEVATNLSKVLPSQQTLQGRIEIGDITLFRIHAKDVSFGMQFKNGQLTLRNIKASLYGGTLEGTVDASILLTQPAWQWDLRAKNLQMQTLLDDVSDGSNTIKISGLNNVNFAAKSQGKSKSEIFANMNGRYSTVIEQGEIKGIDFNYLISSADALLQKRRLDSVPTMEQTEFDLLSADFDIKKGVSKTDNLLMKAKAFVINGTGSIVVNEQRIDLEINLKPLQKTSSKRDWGIPILIHGNLYSPSVSLDMTEVQKLISRQEINDVKSKLKDQVKEHVPGKVGDFLQKILR